MSIVLKYELENSILIEFSKVTFRKEEKYFEVSTETGEHSFSVDYIPELETDFESKEFELFFFSNKYLDAENDIFEIHEKDIKKRIGWLFPIQVLESNENDFSGNRFLNRYKYPVFKLLLKGGNTIKYSFNSLNQLKLSDIYHDDIIIFAMSKDSVSQNEPFNIIDYLPSFANCGYYKWSEGHHQYYEQQKSLSLKIRRKKKIIIKKSNINIKENQFLKELYTNHLKSINHFLLKFYFLYQVIEHLMEENFDSDFDVLVEEYKSNKLSKNDLKEKINVISKERGNISSLFQKAKINPHFHSDFKRDCKLLLDNFYSDPPEDIGNLIYDTRNLVVHRYREIMKKSEHIKIFELITHELELIINELIINYSLEK